MKELTYWGSINGRDKLNHDNLLAHAINREHSYKPTFVYYGGQRTFNNVFYGIELEVNSLYREPSYSARDMLAVVNGSDRRFYCKRDGSVRSGFEFNSMPHTLAAFKEDYDPTVMQHMLNVSNIVAGDDCGFHVHISRDGIRDVELFTQNVYAVIPLLLFWSRRTDYRSISNYCSVKNDDKALYDNLRFVSATTRKPHKALSKDPADERSSQRYQAVNDTNGSTIEIRLFKGTTDWEYVINTLELLDSLVKISNSGRLLGTIMDFVNFTDDEKVSKLIENVYTDFRRQMKLVSELRRRKQLYGYTDSERFNEHDKGVPDAVIYRVFKNIKPGDILYDRRTLERIKIHKRLFGEYNSNVRRREISYIMESTYEVMRIVDDLIIVRRFDNTSFSEVKMSDLGVDYIPFRRVLGIFAGNMSGLLNLADIAWSVHHRVTGDIRATLLNTYWSVVERFGYIPYMVRNYNNFMDVGNLEALQPLFHFSLVWCDGEFKITPRDSNSRFIEDIYKACLPLADVTDVLMSVEERIDKFVDYFTTISRSRAKVSEDQFEQLLLLVGNYYLQPDKYGNLHNHLKGNAVDIYDTWVFGDSLSSDARERYFYLSRSGVAGTSIEDFIKYLNGSSFNDSFATRTDNVFSNIATTLGVEPSMLNVTQNMVEPYNLSVDYDEDYSDHVEWVDSDAD